MTTTTRRVAAVEAPPRASTDLDVDVLDRQARALHWGPIWGGLLAAFGVFLLLSLLSIGLGVGRLSGENADTVATLIGSAIGLLSLAFGGFVAAWSGVVRNPARGVLHGFLVWALWVALLVVLASFGAGQLLGSLGSLLDQLQAPNLTQQQVVDAVRTASLQTFLALALTAAAAMLGGALGVALVPDRAEVVEAST